MIHGRGLFRSHIVVFHLRPAPEGDLATAVGFCIDKSKLVMQTSWRTTEKELQMHPNAAGTNVTQVQGFLKRPVLYDNIDGVGELRMGFMCLAFALLGWLQLHAPRDSACTGCSSSAIR